MADEPRDFISYSLDSDDHADRVLDLADVLRDDGIDVILDRYVHPAPAEGWPRWMDRNLDEAQFVLMICTKTFRRRVMGQEEPGKGLGVEHRKVLDLQPDLQRQAQRLAVHPDPPASRLRNRATSLTPFRGIPTIGSRRSTSPTRVSGPCTGT